jgi:hypothetical protein
MTAEGGAKAPSYRNIAANDPENVRARRSSFEPPPHLREQYLQEEMHGSTGTNMDAETSHPKAARPGYQGNAFCKPRLHPDTS